MLLKKQTTSISKPRAFSGKNYPLNELTDRQFEELLYTLYKNKKSKDYNLVTLMQGVGERGRDITLRLNETVIGIIQCKKVSKNLGQQAILEEIIKFILHSIIDPDLLPNRNEFNYYLAVSTGLSESGIDLIDDFHQKASTFNKLQETVERLTKKYKKLNGINFQNVEPELRDILSKIKVYKIIPTDINTLINQDSKAAFDFFEVRKVTDNSLIQNVLEALTVDEEKELNDFLGRYKKSAIEKLNVVNFFGLDLGKFKSSRPSDLNLLDVFVKPTFTEKNVTKVTGNGLTINLSNRATPSIQRGIANKTLSLQNIFSTDQNIVILGDPGAGKSLLVKFIVLNILKNSQSELSTIYLLERIPFRIELRKYAEEKVKNRLNPIQYLADLLSKDYQVQISEALLTKIITSRESVIFFDGLDEIFDLKVKSEVKESIELFSELYPLSRIIITSRFIGYDDIKFNQEKFTEYSICNFSIAQINELVTKFYKTQIYIKQKREEASENCIKQIAEIDYELKSNPLILTLIIILVKSDLEVPESKLEVYEACTNTLVEKRDELEKGIKIPFKNNKRLFANLAYWQYEQNSKKNIITFDKAKRQLAKYMVEKEEFNDFDDAERVAEKFLEYAEKRSIYFDNNFTHKTFLEYYTAYYIYIKYDGKGHLKERNKLINKYITNPFWHVVFELLISIIDRIQEDNEVLDTLIESQINLHSTNSDVYYFFLLNLKKINNVSKKIRKRLIKESIYHCINGNDASSYPKKPSPLDPHEGYLFPLLAKNSLLPAFSDLFQEIILEFENELEDDELIYKLYLMVYEFAFLNGGEKKLVINNSSKLMEFAKTRNELFIHHSFSSAKTSEKLINQIVEQASLFGIDSPFTPISFLFRRYSRVAGLFFIYISRLFREERTFLQVEADFSTLNTNGISNDFIIKKIGLKEQRFFATPNQFDRFLKIYLDCNNDSLDIIFSKILELMEFNRDVYEKNRKPKFASKFTILDKIFKTKKGTVRR